jgi:hypothetical protein
MITAWAVYLFGCALLLLAIDFGWPKWMPPTTAPGIYVFAFGGEVLIFLGLLLITKII